MQTVDVADHSVRKREFHRRLLEWGEQHRRSYPWRETRDPYKILMAEFMLVRTRANQVEPVYRTFMEHYPDLEALGEASREDIHECLNTLGLRWRADCVYETAKILKEEYEGAVPGEKEKLMALPGVSQYIAGAVRCFAWEVPEPLIDTNTVRIAGRLFGLDVKSSSRRTTRFRQLISQLLNQERPRDYNLSLLDLGALICTKKKAPECHRCPLVQQCQYGQNQLHK